ncbi:expressed unknown protein [Seminavis robusta]|uniref:Uncharacterized protein n=1 Tax=Seminavis robusta TaxID=568900 RepID=A0A9N8D6N7_9STRA|nr:expressed unknown protein [Seminavis robusta]|eukprot:Sro19_g013531.1  (107) ;mRNA; f:105675-105995
MMFGVCFKVFRGRPCFWWKLSQRHPVASTTNELPQNLKGVHSAPLFSLGDPNHGAIIEEEKEAMAKQLWDAIQTEVFTYSRLHLPRSAQKERPEGTMAQVEFNPFD